MTIQRFEDLEIWQEARGLCKKIRYIAVNSSLSTDYGLKNQILNSSGSVMDNIAEGFERDGQKEFLNFLYYAKGSLGEARSQVHRIFDSGHIKEEEYQLLIDDCLMLIKRIKSFINYIATSEYPGHKKK